MFSWITDRAWCFGNKAFKTEVATEVAGIRNEVHLQTYRPIVDSNPREKFITSKTPDGSFDNSEPFQGQISKIQALQENDWDFRKKLCNSASTRLTDSSIKEHLHVSKSTSTSQIARIHENDDTLGSNLPNAISEVNEGHNEGHKGNIHDHVHLPRKLLSLEWPTDNDAHLEHGHPKRSDDFTREKYDKLQMKVSEQNMKMIQLKKKIANQQKENEELLTRLSRYTSNQVADNNPNIADLGDMNRPTKLADKFSEMYDNEWTEAFDSLMNECNLSEESAIKDLLQTLKTIFDVCQTESSARIEHAVKAINELTKQNEVGIPATMEHQSCLMTSEPVRRAIKELKEERKRNYKAFLPELHMKVESSLSTPQSMQDVYNKTFVTKATALCWLMCIQDPPMVLCFTGQKGKKFDAKLFRHYTETGKYTDFVVWPALLLHEGGSLLSRGVAQGRERKKKKKKVSTSKDLFRSKDELFDNAPQNDKEEDDEHKQGDLKYSDRDSDQLVDTNIVVEPAEED